MHICGFTECLEAAYFRKHSSTNCSDLAPLFMSQSELIKMIPPTEYIHSWLEKYGKATCNIIMRKVLPDWLLWGRVGEGEWLIII